MPDILIKVYLYLLIFTSVLFALLHAVLWLAQRQRPRHPLITRKLLWRNVFFLLSGLVGWCFFSRRVLNNWLVLVCVSLMLIISVFVAEAIKTEPKQQ